MVSVRPPEVTAARSAASAEARLRTPTRGTVDLPYRYLLWLAGLWVAGIVLLIALQLLGTEMGWRVRPMGEDRNMVFMFQNNSVLNVPRIFWLWNDRNPLYPWWWVAGQPLIMGSPYGIYLWRRPLDLFCSIVVFLLVDQLGRGRHRFFAFCCALLALLWNFTGYREQIIFPSIAATSLSLLSVYCYCRYLDSERCRFYYLPVSIALYLFALGTNSLQASILLAVPFLAFFRPSPLPRTRGELVRRLASTVADTAMYAMPLFFFLLVWYTASRVSSDYYAVSISLIPQQLPWSLWYLVWHYDYSVFLKQLVTAWSPTSIIVSGAVATTIFAVMLRAAQRYESSRSSADGDDGPVRSDVSADTPSLRSVIACILGILAALAVATVSVESTSGIWAPGARSKYFQQSFHPLLYTSAFFAVAAAFRRHSVRMARVFQVGAMAVISAVVLLVNLEYNRQLNQNTSIEEGLERGLKALVPRMTHPIWFIVKLDGVAWPNSDSLSEIYVQTFYRSPLPKMRVLERGPAVTQWTDYSTIVFGPDAQGVQIAVAGGDPRWIPYDQVLFVEYDGERVIARDTIRSEDVAGFRVGFARDGPVESRAFSPATGCSFSSDFDTVLRGLGWSSPETTPSGVSFQWMDNTEASIYLSLSCEKDAIVEFRVPMWMDVEIVNSLRLSVNGQPIEIRARGDDGGALVYRAVVAREVLASGEAMSEIKFAVNRTIVPEGGTRRLAVAFDWFRLVTVEQAGVGR